MNIKQIIEESIQGYALPKKKSCSCGCNKCEDKKINESLKDVTKKLIRETLRSLNEDQSEDSIFANKLSQLLFNLLSKEVPLVAFSKWKEYLDERLDIKQINELVKYLWDKKGQVNKNHLKQLAKEKIVQLLSKESLSEETTTFLYKLEGILVTNTHERNQTDILSDIRSISGVTIVSSKEYSSDTVTDSKDYKTYLTVKIDPHPFIGKGGFGKEQLKLIYNEIKRVIGVKAFRLKKKPERINESNQTKGQNFGFWFRAGVRGEKQAEQAKQLLNQKGIDFEDQGRFAIDFKEKNLDKGEIMQLMRDNNITLYVVYDHN